MNVNIGISISNLSSDETEAFKELKEDQEDGVVIMDKTDYMKKIKELLDDQSEFRSDNNDESVKDENLINRCLAQLEKK
ncbi:unnamed protein product [Rotaria sp. Silwood2]|nr:unnamed protein product [Rotaria sp. Silwood2]CAF3168914.1 unnamed protein product [Rotaria sp. Silwood2]CAF3248247.1 unnamed protein product [Rotaria sp. Silwood2]CAF3341364.1 unnamed protein product [Rotaria sp. Silwood2]CAF4125580.1 unnamed protein product [Rotaria sp. Silwood2]